MVLTWILGARSSDKGDSVLAAEVAAAGRLLRDLDSRITRVAVITFSGPFEPGSSLFDRLGDPIPDYVIHLPLTNDFRLVRDACQECNTE